MKTAAIIVLLGAFVCGVVCDAVAEEGKQQTAEAQHHPNPGRSHDSEDYDGHLDGDYGHHKKHHRHHDKDGYKHHDDDSSDDYKHSERDSYYPKHSVGSNYPACTQTCLCSKDLTLTAINTANGCNNNGCGGVASFCDTGVSVACPCATTAIYGAGTTFGYCGGPYLTAGGGGGGLCLQAICPADGVITLRGQAVALNCGCGAQNFVYIFKNTAFSNAASDKLVDNKQSAEVTEQCKAGDKYFVCEDYGVLITSSIKATFTVQAKGACSSDFKSLGCKL